MATQQEVRALHEQNKLATVSEIARALDCTTGYVRATARRLKLSIPTDRQPSEASLGRAARAAGMTLADIHAWAEQRKDEPK